MPCTLLDAGAQVCETGRRLAVLERAFCWRAQNVDKPHGAAMSRVVTCVPKERYKAL